MSRRLLLSGDRKTFTTVDFDEEQGKLTLVANYTAPYNVSWVEPVATHGDVDYLYGLEEGYEDGGLYTFEIDNKKQTCVLTSRQPTLGAPGHFMVLADKSAVALITYMGGSAALYPIKWDNKSTFLLEDVPRSEVQPAFPYKAEGFGPNKGRQEQCHVHQILQAKDGHLYAPDLGTDRVWIFRQQGKHLEQCGWLQCPPGSGPRHAVFNPDESIMYVIGEMSHTVTAFDLPSEPSDDIKPITGFAPNIIPPTVHKGHDFMMDSSEICTHPTIPNVLYVSNRWERHIAEREPHLENVPEELQKGDTVAIILLSKDGRSVEKLLHVRTELDTIRGMRVRDDGKYIVVEGQEGGGIEVYRIDGDRGDTWTLAARLRDGPGVESGIKHAIWL